MTQEFEEFVPNEEQKELLDQIYTTFYVLINKATGIPPDQLSDEHQASDIFEKVESYGYVLATLQTYFELKPDYVSYSEFDEFPTLGEAFNHIAGRILIKEGLLSLEEI